MTVDDAIHNLGPGDAILQQPGGREVYRFDKEQASEHSWCLVGHGILSEPDMSLLGSVKGVHRASPAIQRLIEEGVAMAKPDHPQLHAAAAALARACLMLFAAQAGPDAASSGAVLAHPALERMEEIAARGHATLRSAGDLARRAGVSSAHLRALCRGSGRESPSAVIRRLKAEHAIQLIRSTGLTLAEIAEACGYANAFHLSRVIRQRTGRSPRDVRKIEWSRR